MLCNCKCMNIILVCLFLQQYGRRLQYSSTAGLRPTDVCVYNGFQRILGFLGHGISKNAKIHPLIGFVQD
jgi:hypothetical protein